jgi:hypothetical protein
VARKGGPDHNLSERLPPAHFNNRQLTMKKKILILLLPVLLLGCVPKSELEKTQSDLADAQAKIAVLQQENATLQQENEATKSFLEQAEAEVAELKPLAAKARTLPIRWGVTKGILASGYVLIIHNETITPIRLDVTWTANGRTKPLPSFVLDGVQYHRLPGLAPGDTLTIESEGFDPMTLTIP